MEIKAKIGLNPCGAYDGTREYSFLDTTESSSGTYMSLKDNNKGHEVTDTTWWECIIDLTGVNNATASANTATQTAITAENARVEAENSRVSAETSRSDAESSRVNAEKSRVSSESSRSEEESSRQTAESERQTNETARKANETSRQSAEADRATKETARQSSETTRQANETLRVNAESLRVTAETARESVIGNFQMPVSETLSFLLAKIRTLENQLNSGELGDVHLTSLTIDDVYKICGQKSLIEGSGAPSDVADVIGQRYHDVTNKKVYEAFGTSSISDWIILN